MGSQRLQAVLDCRSVSVVRWSGVAIKNMPDLASISTWFLEMAILGWYRDIFAHKSFGMVQIYWRGRNDDLWRGSWKLILLLIRWHRPVLGSRSAWFSPFIRDVRPLWVVGFILKLPPTKNLRVMMSVGDTVKSRARPHPEHRGPVIAFFERAWPWIRDRDYRSCSDRLNTNVHLAICSSSAPTRDLDILHLKTSKYWK